MAPARRQNHARSYSTSYNTPSYAPILQQPPNQDLMPPTSRYLHNLRVIQRHDPSITALFDQFPHVCVYHHKGDEWRKKGCEGAMFLFEREEEPKYGFYILNRNNTGDYIQRMTPDDDVEFASAYLIYRAYGKVTSDTIGLWTMVTQDREAMSQVMMRLHSYIKRGIRYPDEYRRRPDTWSTTPAPVHAQAQSTLPSTQNPSSASMSALSALLAKLGSPLESPSSPSPPTRTVSASVPPPTTGIPLLDSIFASASEVASPNATPQAPSASGNVLRNLFANGMASANASSPASTSCGPTPTQHVSPLPESSSPNAKAKVNGTYSNSGHGVLPHKSVHVGRETDLAASMQLNGWKANTGNIAGGKYSVRYPTISEQSPQDDEGSLEEDGVASVSVGASEDGANVHSPSGKNKPWKTRKRERERERRRALKQGAVHDTSDDTVGKRTEEHVAWPLVDDRSLSVDESDEKDHVGLGDGLLNALAAVSDPEMLSGRTRSFVMDHSKVSKRGRKERGRDRWKRKHREDAIADSQTSDTSGNVGSSVHLEEVGNALLDAYGHRRRIGDSVLDQEALANEIMELLQNDHTFVRHLHQQYLKRVQV